MVDTVPANKHHLSKNYGRGLSIHPHRISGEEETVGRGNMEEMAKSDTYCMVQILASTPNDETVNKLYHIVSEVDGYSTITNILVVLLLTTTSTRLLLLLLLKKWYSKYIPFAWADGGSDQL